MPANLDPHGSSNPFFLPETTTPAELHAFIKGFLARTAESDGSFPTGEETRIYLRWDEEESCFKVAFFGPDAETKGPYRMFKSWPDRVEEINKSSVYEVSARPGILAYLISRYLRSAGIICNQEKEAERTRARW
ncbi:MAG TPA: hypothetical protein VF303_00480 [Candidatus Nanoarchaeia archaeon]